MSTEQTGGTPAPRTLADDLRSRDDSALAALLRARPDLLSPVPSDLTQLATRAGTRASVVRAVERLDRFALQTAQALAVAPDPCSYATLEALLAGDPEAADTEQADAEQSDAEQSDADEESVSGEGAEHGARARTAAVAADVAAQLPRAVGTLRARALLWGTDEALHLVRTARELLAPSATSPSPTGLGPTLADATAGMSPGRLQEILSTAGLDTTHDPVSALAALTGLFTDRARMSALLDTAPRESLALLDRLRWGPPYGSTEANAPSRPVSWLLDRGLLVRTGPRTVVLPREVALHLRGGRAHRVVEPVPPPIGARRTYRPETVDATAAGQAFTALGTVEELLAAWESEPPSVLRAGGLGVRDLKRTAAALDLPEPTAAFWIELAYAAGLLAPDGAIDEAYAPTPAYDDWLNRPAHERWTHLALRWLTATRVPGLVGERDAKGRTLTALGPGLDRGTASDVRRRVLELLASLEPGTAPEPDAVPARLRWERPLRGGAPARSGTGAGAEQPDPGAGGRGTGASGSSAAATRTGTGAAAAAPGAGATGAGATGTGGAGGAADLRSRIAEWTLHEAELLGLTGRGALASYARALLAPPAEHVAAYEHAAAEAASATALSGPLPGQPPSLPSEFDALELTASELAAAAQQSGEQLAPLLPEPVDHVLLQADLTAVAPGPLERSLAASLATLADVESKGGATVYRFTPGSVRRGLDAGHSSADIHAFLAEHSQTPVPQPLSYLVDDVARRHGTLRVGAASSYVRCDDEALLNEIVADKRSAPLRPRRLAPTVLASTAPPDQLLGKLREMGYAPAAESAEGDVLVARPAAHRTPPRTAPEPVPDGPPVPETALLTAAVRAIRAGDRAASTPPRQQPSPARHGSAPKAAAPDSPPPRTSSAEALAAVQSAALTGGTVCIGYVNADGAATRRLIAPVRVEGGLVTAYDHTADEVRTYPLHRITGVAETADG